MNTVSDQVCSYYQANVKKTECWMLTATLRSFEHLAFDRTLDKEQSLFEFFVPTDNEERFLEIMRHFQAIGLIHDLQKKPNRLATEDTIV